MSKLETPRRHALMQKSITSPGTPHTLFCHLKNLEKNSSIVVSLLVHMCKLTCNLLGMCSISVIIDNFLSFLNIELNVSTLFVDIILHRIAVELSNVQTNVV